MDSNEIFKSLRQSTPYKGEVDKVIDALDRVVIGLGRVLGPHAKDFNNVVEELKTSIQSERDKKLCAWTIFSGEGSLAMKLVEHAKIDQLLHGKHSRTKRAHISELVAMFNHEPSRDPAQLYDMERLVRKLQDLVDPLNPTITPVVVYEPTSISEMVTGFHRTPDYYQPAGHSLSLAGEIAESKIRFMVFAASETGVSIWLYHPQEDIWVSSNIDMVIPGFLDAVEAELEKAVAELHEATRSKDWAAEWKRLQVKIIETFHRSSVLNHRQTPFKRHTPDHKEIRFEEAGRTVLFTSTTGEFPQTSTMFFQGNENAIAFTERFEDMPPALQQRMTLSIDRQLDALLQLIDQKESELEASAPASPTSTEKVLS